MAMYPEIYMYMAPVVGVIVYGAAYIFWRISVKRYFCKDKITLSIEKDNHKIRLKLLKFLVEGKACCHLVDDERWDWVRKIYLDNISTNIYTKIE